MQYQCNFYMQFLYFYNANNEIKMAKIIPLIHNYCDRWCEKCMFVDKCAVGIQETKMSAAEKDINNKEFWDNLGLQFKMALVLLDKKMKEEGIILTKADEKHIEEETIKYDGERELIQKNHPISIIASDYSRKVKSLLDKEEFLSQYNQSLIQQIELGISSKSTIESELTQLKEGLDAIHWYTHFIWVKFMRALSPSLGLTDDDDLLSDKNGSAKVALLAVESSLGAWHHLYSKLNVHQDEILDLMAMLQKILRLGKEEFPKAMNFIRPGFDEGWQQAWDMGEEEDSYEDMKAEYEQYMLELEEE